MTTLVGASQSLYTYDGSAEYNQQIGYKSKFEVRRMMVNKTSLPLGMRFSWHNLPDDVYSPTFLD